MSQKRKVTLYFNSAMLAETQKEALRQDRSISWIIQAAWRLARDEVTKMPSALPQQQSQAVAVEGAQAATIPAQNGRPVARTQI